MSAPEGDEEGEPKGRTPVQAARYSTIVGLAFLALVAYVTFNSVRTDEGGLLGSDRAEAGTPLAEFAVPDIAGELVGDANVFQDDCETSANPCPEGDRRTPACRVRGPGVIRVCDYFDRPLVISFWFTRGGDCLPAQDTFDSVARRLSGSAGFLSINVRDERAAIREIVAERGWQVPVGWDRDGAVSNIYRVGVCPTLAFVFPGGILQRAAIGSDELTEARLTASVSSLVAQSRRREAAG